MDGPVIPASRATTRSVTVVGAQTVLVNALAPQAPSVTPLARHG